MTEDTSDTGHLRAKTKALNSVRNWFRGPLCESILLRLVAGTEPSDLISKMVPNHYQYPPGSLRSVLRNGIAFDLDISDLIQWFIYFGMKERSRTALFSLVRCNDVVIDVGTNIGDVLLNCAKAVGPQGRVYGFEPDPMNFQRCMRNIQINKFGNITMSAKGLGHVNAECDLHVTSSRNRGANRISVDSHGGTTRIKIGTLDEFIVEQAIERIDLIKIDVEGFEMNVLLGAKSAIERFKPNLFIELDDNNLRLQGSSALELISYVESAGYRLFHAETKRPISRHDRYVDCHFDIVCLRIDAAANWAFGSEGA